MAQQQCDTNAALDACCKELDQTHNLLHDVKRDWDEANIRMQMMGLSRHGNMRPPSWCGSRMNSHASHPKKQVLVHHEWYPDGSGSRIYQTDPEVSEMESLDSVQFTPKVDRSSHHRISSHHQCKHRSCSHSPQCHSNVHQLGTPCRCSPLRACVNTPMPQSQFPSSPFHSTMSGCNKTSILATPGLNVSDIEGDPLPPPPSQPHQPLLDAHTDIIHGKSLEVVVSPRHGPSPLFIISPNTVLDDQDENTPPTSCE